MITKIARSTLFFLLAAMAVIVAGCAADGVTDPLQNPTEEPIYNDPLYTEYGFSVDGQTVYMGAQPGEFPWGYNLTEISREAQGPNDDAQDSTTYTVDCGAMRLSYTHNNETGAERLVAMETTTHNILSYRGIGVGMAESYLLSLYPEQLYHGTVATNPYAPDNFFFSDAFYAYAPADGTFCHIVFYLYKNTISGMAIFDLENERLYQGESENMPEVDAAAAARQLYEAFNALKNHTKLDDAPAESRQQFFALLPNADWGELWLLGTDTSRAASEIIDWLYGRTDFTDAELLDLMNTATSNIDGAISEGYAAIMARLFVADMPRFLTLMGELDGYTQEKVAFFTADIKFQQEESPWESLTGLNAEQEAMLKLITDKIAEFYS